MHLLRATALALCAFPLLAAEANQLDGNVSLFTIMAALDAAEVLPPSDHALRAAFKVHLAGRKTTVVPDLKRFVIAHRKADPNLNISQYISFALSHTDAPAFERRYRSNEVPEDAAEVAEIAGLAARFYEEAGIEEFWKKYQPLLEGELARYQGPVTNALLEVNGYLRNPTSGYMGRKFVIYLDLYGPYRSVQTRSYGDDYFVVAPVAPKPQVFDIRHAYFHHMLDPLVTKYSANVDKKKSLIDFAQGAPLLSETYKSDWLLLVTESLIKVIESRLARDPGQVQQALTEGYVLAPFFAEHLPIYEKQESAMRLYFPEMIDAIDLKKETRRLDQVKFAAARPEPPAPAPKEAPLTQAQQTLEEAERLSYGDKAYDKAKDAYLRLLQQTDDKSLHARAYYGMARIALQEKNPELADRLFRRTLELAPDAQTRSWTHVYLGRLSDLAKERDEAVKHYQAALGVDGASEAARHAAEQGLKTSFGKN